jgi:hypothetical protein
MRQERRRYFRVETDSIVTFRAITAEEKQAGIARLHQGDMHHPDQGRLFLKLDADLHDGLNRLRQKSPEIAALLDLVNRKINLIANKSQAHKSESLLDKAPQTINLSACGMAFHSQELIEDKQDIEWELILLPDQTYVHGYGHIAGCETAQNAFLLRINFDAMREEDLERLLQYIMRKESEWLKAKHKTNQLKSP